MTSSDDDRLIQLADIFHLMGEPNRLRMMVACRDEAELHKAAAALTAAGVEHTRVKSDPALAGRKYIAFKDPDRIAWEFYMTA